jgi:hypothetical protein
MESISATELNENVAVLADDRMEGRQPGTAGGKAAAVYLMKEFASRDLVPAGDLEREDYFQSFRSGYRNVLGLLPGSDPELKEQVVIVGAHFDHVGRGSSRTSRGGVGRIHNGADDNASGTAAVLEVVDAMTRLPQGPKRSVLFALWDGEEIGLLGSKHWISNPTVPADKVAFALNLDMVGRLRDEKLQVIGTRSTLGLRQLVSRQNADIGLHLEFPWKVNAKSDHSTFYDHGIPVLMFHTGLHDDFHTPRDDPELLNAEGMQEVTRLLFHVVWEIADRNERPAFRMTSRKETDSARKRLERATPPMPPRVGIWWNDSEEEKQRPGLLITKVVEDSAAEEGGLAVGDRIVHFDGQVITGETEFRAAVAVATNPVAVVVQRDGQPEPITLEVNLSGTPVRVGISWREDPAEPRALFLVQVVPGSPAERAGLQVGDRIYEISDLTFTGSDQFMELINSLPGPLTLLVERNGRVFTVTVEVDSPSGMARAFVPPAAGSI